MKNIVYLFVIMIFSCVNMTTHQYEEQKKPDEGVEKKDTSMQLINLGTIDDPVYFSIELSSNVDEFYNTKNKRLVSVKFTAIASHETYNLNYILDNELKTESLFYYLIEPYPGDLTLRITTQDDTLIATAIGVDHRFDRNYRDHNLSRLATISKNFNGEYVSDNDIEFELKKDDDKILLTTLDEGSLSTKTCVFKDKIVNDVNLLQYNKLNQTIVILDKDSIYEVVLIPYYK